MPFAKLFALVCIFSSWSCTSAQNELKSDRFLKVDVCFDPTTTNSTSHKVANNQKCALWCLQSERCKSYSVETPSQVCYLNDNLLPDNGCLNGFTHFNSKQVMDNARCLNEGIHNVATNTCTCINSFVGDRCERLMYDCTDGFESGFYTDMDHVFTIRPILALTPVRVRCIMKWGGRTAILYQDCDKPYVNFTRDWAHYKTGFGDMEANGNFYIGNDIIHLITTSSSKTLLMNAVFDSEFAQYLYGDVQVAGEKENYRLSYDNNKKWPHGTKPLDDCFPANNIPFSTIDQDNDADSGSCALTHMSGWWFDACGPCNPTGQVQAKSETSQSPDPTMLRMPLSSNKAVRKIAVFLV